jgi:hypothetical protein
MDKTAIPCFEVQFEYSRYDWVQINTQNYKNWLHGLRPLNETEFWLLWLLLAVAVFGGLGSLVFLGVAIWLSLAWYFVVGAAVLIVFSIGMVKEIIRPQQPMRGLMDELIFRMGIEEQAVERYKHRADKRFARQEAKGEVVFGQRYTLQLEPEGYVLTVDYPAAAGPTTRSQTHTAWSAVHAVDIDDHMLSLQLGEAGNVFVPRSAFPDDEAFHDFAHAAEEYRSHASAIPKAATAIQTLSQVKAF